MNLWIIAGIIIGVLAIAGIAVVQAVANNADNQAVDSSTCTSCGNSCTAGSNCGLATCGSANGGSCGCGK